MILCFACKEIVKHARNKESVMLLMKIVILETSRIKEYKKNAKRHPKKQIEQIKKSIKEFGFNDPIAIDENNVIIEGHGRFKALQVKGVFFYVQKEAMKCRKWVDQRKK